LSGSARLLKIRIIAVGKNKDRWVDEGCAHFEKLLQRFASIEWKIIPSPKGPSSLAPAEVKKKEGELLQKQFRNGIHIVLTDKGLKKDTLAFANFFERLQITKGGMINFIIGGPYGLDDTILKKFDHRLSLSPLTFSHQLVRLVLLEQLYRAFSVIHGTDYHK